MHHLIGYPLHEAERLIAEKATFWVATASGVKEIIATRKRREPGFPSILHEAIERWYLYDQDDNLIDSDRALPDKRSALERALIMVGGALETNQKERLRIMKEGRELEETQKQLLVQIAELRR